MASRRQTGGPSGSRVEISVVVPAYNGERTIVDSLHSIVRATRDRPSEIIVSDSSTDATPDLIRHNFPDVTLIRSDRRLTAGEARHRGAAAARGDFVFFTDQDCVVPADWVDRMAAHFRNPEVSGVGGAVGIRNPSSASGCALYFLEFLYQFPGKGAPQVDDRFLVGCNSAYRASVLREVRFPDLTLGEDVLFWHRLRGQGFHTVHDPTIEVLHQNREGWKVFFLYNHQMGRAAARYHAALGLRPIFLRHPILAFVAPAAVLPFVAWALRRSPRGYRARFAMLAPACLLGNLTWATGFWRQRRERLSAEESSPATLTASDAPGAPGRPVSAPPPRAPLALSAPVIRAGSR